MRTIALIVALLVSACASAESYYRSQTVGRVGCPAEEIRVKAGADSASWTAMCRGRVYYCRDEWPNGASCHAAD